MSRGTCWLFHRWSDWRVKPDPTPYTLERFEHFPDGPAWMVGEGMT